MSAPYTPCRFGRAGVPRLGGDADCEVARRQPSPVHHLLEAAQRRDDEHLLRDRQELYDGIGGAGEVVGDDHVDRHRT